MVDNLVVSERVELVDLLKNLKSQRLMSVVNFFKLIAKLLFVNAYAEWSKCNTQKNSV
jgi:hypothetical protein